MECTTQELPALSTFSELPPTERDFAVFEAVRIDRRSTRDVAREFSISQTRVCQVLERVATWQCEALPEIERNAPAEIALQAARCLSADRLDHLYGLAVRGFEHSKRDLVRTRVNANGDETTTTTNHSGDVRYLTAAMRIVLATAKAELPRGLIIESQALAADLMDQEIAETATDADRRPSVGDCSANGAAGEQKPTTVAVSATATPRKQETSKRLNRRQRRAREKFFAPVHAATAAGADYPGSSIVAQLHLSPNQPGARLEVVSGDPPAQRNEPLQAERQTA